MPTQNLSHKPFESSFFLIKQKLIDKVKTRGDLPYVSVEKQLELLEKLAEFELGKFLIETGGLNGYWTHYIVKHPEEKKAKELNPIESFLLNKAPICLATQERFLLFKKEIQKRLKKGCSMAAIPSGLMTDLLDLNFAGIEEFSLHGIDLEQKALSEAKEYAVKKNLLSHCHFMQSDAWNLPIKEEFDLITSNGLNFYEPDDEKVIALYQKFYSALKPKGTLITSFLTPPPPSEDTEWNLSEVNQQDALLQKILVIDILDGRWQVFRKEKSVKEHLEKVGFKQIEILYDKAHIFPTVIAKK